MNVNDFISRKCTHPTKEEIKQIYKDYKEISFEGSFIDKNSEYYNDDKYKWEMVTTNDHDYKYGRMMISREYKLIRRTTMGEFYGAGTVD